MSSVTILKGGSQCVHLETKYLELSVSRESLSLEHGKDVPESGFEKLPRLHWMLRVSPNILE